MTGDGCTCGRCETCWPERAYRAVARVERCLLDDGEPMDREPDGSPEVPEKEDEIPHCEGPF